MLIEESHVDAPTKAGGDMSMPFSDLDFKIAQADSEPGIFLFHPKIDGYPKARFPGVVVFSEIYQGEWGSMHLVVPAH